LSASHTKFYNTNASWIPPSAVLRKYLSSFVDTMKLGELGKLGKLGEILAVQLFLHSCTRMPSLW